MRIVDNYNHVNLHLVLSNAKIGTLKVVPLPRLELYDILSINLNSYPGVQLILWQYASNIISGINILTEMTFNFLSILSLVIDRTKAWDDPALSSRARKQKGIAMNLPIFRQIIVRHWGRANYEQTKCRGAYLRTCVSIAAVMYVRIATPIIASNVITKHEKSSSGGEYMKEVCDCVYWKCISKVYELVWKWRNMAESWDECYVRREVYIGLSTQLGTRAGDNIWPTIYYHNQTLLANYELLLEL